ncbi:MAG: PTS sugar transporter subunit IIA, partial [Candidatus Omnitrophica bacterium]|nr:PTS sugar transporter subunit IIA [Candidatus Omnitrophota bacterium]
LFEKFMKREEESSTVIRKSLAIPHILVDTKDFHIMLVRARSGVIFPDDQLAHIIFIILGPPAERNLHLKILAAIAQITENPDFDTEWTRASNKDEIKTIVLLAERRRG